MSSGTSSNSKPRASTRPAVERPDHERVVRDRRSDRGGPAKDRSLDCGRVAKPALTDAIQDYLREIYKLRAGGGRVSVTALAKRQGVSPASASAMVKKLAALKLAVHEPYRGVALTTAGERVALEVIRHHRLLELYLAETLGARRRRRPRRSRTARARHLGGARGANRQGARLSDPRPARGSDPGREPSLAPVSIAGRRLARGEAARTGRPELHACGDARSRHHTRVPDQNARLPARWDRSARARPPHVPPRAAIPVISRESAASDGSRSTMRLGGALYPNFARKRRLADGRGDRREAALIDLVLEQHLHGRVARASHRGLNRGRPVTHTCGSLCRGSDHVGRRWVGRPMDVSAHTVEGSERPGGKVSYRGTVLCGVLMSPGIGARFRVLVS